MSNFIKAVRLQVDARQRAAAVLANARTLHQNICDAGGDFDVDADIDGGAFVLSHIKQQAQLTQKNLHELITLINL